MPKTMERPAGLTALAPAEQEVVEEFRDAFHRHRNQGVLRVAKLARIGLELAVDPKGKAKQRALAVAVARGFEARQQLAEAEGGSLSSDETATLLGISKTAVLKRLDAGKLLAWREARLKAARFPQWQFDTHGQVLKGLSEVLECLRQNPRLDDWARVLFFLQNRSNPGGQRPLDLLRQGKVKEVCLAAQAYAE